MWQYWFKKGALLRKTSCKIRPEISFSSSRLQKFTLKVHKFKYRNIMFFWNGLKLVNLKNLKAFHLINRIFKTSFITDKLHSSFFKQKKIWIKNWINCKINIFIMTSISESHRTRKGFSGKWISKSLESGLFSTKPN